MEDRAAESLKELPGGLAARRLQRWRLGSVGLLIHSRLIDQTAKLVGGFTKRERYFSYSKKMPPSPAGAFQPVKNVCVGELGCEAELVQNMFWISFPNTVVLGVDYMHSPK